MVYLSNTQGSPRRWANIVRAKTPEVDRLGYNNVSDMRCTTGTIRRKASHIVQMHYYIPFAFSLEILVYQALIFGCDTPAFTWSCADIGRQQRRTRQRVKDNVIRDACRQFIFEAFEAAPRFDSFKSCSTSINTSRLSRTKLFSSAHATSGEKTTDKCE